MISSTYLVLCSWPMITSTVLIVLASRVASRFALIRSDLQIALNCVKCLTNNILVIETLIASNY